MTNLAISIVFFTNLVALSFPVEQPVDKIVPAYHYRLETKRTLGTNDHWLAVDSIEPTSNGIATFVHPLADKARFFRVVRLEFH